MVLSVLSHEFLSFITIWVSEFHHNLSFWVSSQFEFEFLWFFFVKFSFFVKKKVFFPAMNYWPSWPSWKLVLTDFLFLINVPDPDEWWLIVLLPTWRYDWRWSSELTWHTSQAPSMKTLKVLSQSYNCQHSKMLQHIYIILACSVPYY